jgi:hypothetical protein
MGVSVQIGQARHVSEGEGDMTLLFFLGAGWLTLKYPLQTALIVAIGSC